MKILLLALFSSVALGAVNDDMKKRISDGISLAPIIGYDATYGLLLGGAFFRGDTTPPVSNLDLFLYGSGGNAYGIETKFTRWNQGDQFYQVELLTSTFYDRYFGEGNNTDPDVSNRIDLFKVELIPSYLWRLDRELTWGIIGELRYRNETGVDGDSSQSVFGNDFTPLVGALFRGDTRDHQVLTTSGHYYEARVDLGLKALSTRNNAQNFVRFNLESRHFVEVWDCLVLAGNLGLGATTGEPGYQYRFALGGSRKMRGYQGNRLRGRFYYMTQGEARLSILKWLGLVAFAGLGDTADNRLGDFGKPKWTAGGGLRLGLPPDFVARARLDVGISQDELAFFLNFNEAF